MQESQLRLLTRVRDTSSLTVLIGLAVTATLSQILVSEMNWQIAVALIALVIGIPHGAVDHLLAIPNLFSIKMAIFLLKYLLATGLAIWFILQFPLLGFQLIVFFSAAHFGVGDASFCMEIYRRSDYIKFPRALYAIASGFTPVLIPLVNSHTGQALEEINPQLLAWAGPFARQAFFACIALNLIVASLLFGRKMYRPALDLLILLTLVLIAPPLVAFAIYFGLWHAVRHTARLTLEFGPSVRQHELGQTWKSFWLSIRAGLPAVVIVLTLSVWLAFSRTSSTSANLLWYLLVVTWALTVPHMVLTARSDISALSYDKAKGDNFDRAVH